VRGRHCGGEQEAVSGGAHWCGHFWRLGVVESERVSE
jgi:hypothetical protein